jgi:hypothetical protein
LLVIMTLSKATLSIKGELMMLSIHDTQHK